MLGCAISVIIYAGNIFWGSAAAPIGISVLGASGNQTTCSVQGFMLYFTIFVIPFYYASLSFLSYKSMSQKFDYSEILWIEKFLHFGLISMPQICASVVLLADAFNPVLTSCGFSSEPVGCGDDFSSGTEGILCTRGPRNIKQYQFFFGLLPLSIPFCFPAVLMITVYLKARPTQTRSTVGGEIYRESK